MHPLLVLSKRTKPNLAKTSTSSSVSSAHSPKPPLRSLLSKRTKPLSQRRHRPLSVHKASIQVHEASSKHSSKTSSSVHEASLQVHEASPKHSSKTSSSVHEASLQVHKASPKQPAALVSSASLSKAASSSRQQRQPIQSSTHLSSARFVQQALPAASISCQQQPTNRIVRLALPAASSSCQQPANESYYRTTNSPNNQPNLYIIPRQVIMQSTNEEVPTVSPKTTATMHDYFKPADAKKAADVRQGRRLKKRKSIANESIDLDRRGRPSKSHRHDADRSARGLAPKPKDTTSSTSVATKTSTVAVSAPPPTKNKRTNHTVNGAMANAVEEWFRIKDAPNAPSKAAFARQKQLKPDTFKKYVHDVPEKR